MKIYTKSGDGGETSLFGGRRVMKDNLRIEAYGNVDELNSQIGSIRSLHPSSEIDSYLQSIQNDLFMLGADLATPTDTEKEVPRIEASHSHHLETVIDQLESNLSALKAFILPGGTQIAAQLHVARTVCRRTERSVVRLAHEQAIGQHAAVYLNRLSDLLFVMARYENKKGGGAETEWKSRRS